MISAQGHGQKFTALHVPGDPLILFNAWDAGSARVVAAAGARAIATGSWSVAAAHGFPDGEALPIELALANAARIVAAVDLPVTIDFEGGYEVEPEGLGRNVGRLAATGAVGCNLEDRWVGGEGLHPTHLQAERIRAARQASGPDFFLNARTDIFIAAPREAHDEAAVEAAVERARAYADAGASGLFAPGLADLPLIARLCERSPLPVNILALPGVPDADALAGAGVARISHAGAPWRIAMQALEDAARAAHSG